MYSIPTTNVKMMIRQRSGFMVSWDGVSLPTKGKLPLQLWRYLQGSFIYMYEYGYICTMQYTLIQNESYNEYHYCIY